MKSRNYNMRDRVGQFLGTNWRWPTSSSRKLTATAFLVPVVCVPSSVVPVVDRFYTPVLRKNGMPRLPQKECSAGNISCSTRSSAPNTDRCPARDRSSRCWPESGRFVLLPRLDEQRPRRDQAGDVVHLRPVQNARHVVVDAMRQAADAVAKCVQVAADERRLDPRLERGREHVTCRRRKSPSARRASHPAPAASRCSRASASRPTRASRSSSAPRSSAPPAAG